MVKPCTKCGIVQHCEPSCEPFVCYDCHRRDQLIAAMKAGQQNAGHYSPSGNSQKSTVYFHGQNRIEAVSSAAAPTPAPKPTPPPKPTRRYNDWRDEYPNLYPPEDAPDV